MTQTGGTLKVQVSGPNNSVTLLTAASFQGSKTAANDLDAYAAAATKYSTATSANSSALLTAYTNAANKLIADIQNNACQALGQGCFAAGTKLWTPQGYRNVEDIQPGDLVYARDENDPAAPVVVRVVEERFERTGNVLHLHVAGELIRTTPEHPFYVFRKGWTQAGALVEGDWISTLAGGWVVVEELYDTGMFEAVYNLRVAEDHTYFVGDENWAFGVWRHNAYMTNARPPSTNQAELNKYTTGASFSGVYNIAAGVFILCASGNTTYSDGTVPSPRVDRRGGHALVEAMLDRAVSDNGASDVGFAVTINSDGSLSVFFRSGIVNTPRYGNIDAPEVFNGQNLQQPVVQALMAAFGRAVVIGVLPPRT